MYPPLQVYENLCESFSNWWNEILYKYDPADNPSILKEPGLKLFFILCAMTTVSTFKEYFRTENASFWEAAALEKERKGLSAELFWRSLYRSIAPLNVIRSCVRLWSKMVLSIVKLPLMVSKLALDTPVYLYWLYMAHYVVQESLYLFRVSNSLSFHTRNYRLIGKSSRNFQIFYSAPRVIFEEIFLPEHPRNVHQLQTLSFCGRKVVNWSAPVPVEIVKKLRQVTGSTTSEVAMSAVASSLRDYFECKSCRCRFPSTSRFHVDFSPGFELSLK